jgi:hypothetical protein
MMEVRVRIRAREEGLKCVDVVLVVEADVLTGVVVVEVSGCLFVVTRVSKMIRVVMDAYMRVVVVADVDGKSILSALLILIILPRTPLPLPLPLQKRKRAALAKSPQPLARFQRRHLVSLNLLLK